MARELQYQGLAELNVLINDTSKYSSEYFQVTNFPSVFTAGKNLFRFKGIADKFIEESDILIEVLDSNGQPIYYEADLNLESGEQSIIVAVYIDEETPPGSGEIILCGYLSDVVSEDNVPTVRWRQPIDIDPTKQNDTEIIFSVLPAANVSTSSVVDSYTETTYTNSALVRSASINNFTYDYRNNGNPVIIGTVNTAAISSLNVNAGARFEVARSRFTGRPSSTLTLTATTLSASVSGYISTGSNIIFTLSDPFESGIQGSNQIHTFLTGTGTTGSLYFEQNAASTSGTENTYTVISASFTNLQPQVGNIAKIRTFYKSIGVGEYVLASETDILDIATEFGYTPESASIIVPLPTVHRNDRFDLKFQFLNSAEAVSKQVLYIKDVGMPGGNVYIGGDDNLITGSVFVAGQTGTGVSIEGSTEGAFIRSVGYEGFQNVVDTGATGQPGFIMYSGSVSTMLNSSRVESYQGIGLELTAHSESYLRYTTAGGGLLDIRTNRFFLGSNQQYIVGANGLIQISSSNFFLSSSGDVIMAGTITATAGNIGGFTITSHSLSGNNFFISGAASSNGFFISSSRFNVKGNGDVTGSNVLFTGGRIGSFTLTNDAFTGGTSFFISSSVSGTPSTAFFISSSRFNIKQDGTVTGSAALFSGSVSVVGTINALDGNIGGFAITRNAITGAGFFISGSATGDQFFISSSAFNVKANGNVTGSQVLFTGGRIGSFTLSNDAFTAGSTFFISSSVGATPASAFFISSSRFNVRQDGTVTGSNVFFNGGRIAGFTLSNDTLSNASNFFISGSATGNQFFISSSAFNVKANGDVTASSALFSGSVSITGNVNARTGNIGGFNITSDAITGSGFYLSGSATGNQFFISSSNFNVKANGEITGSQVLFTGGRIGSFRLSNDALSGINSSTGNTSFFVSSSVDTTSPDGVAFFISSSKFNVRQDGTISGSNVLFNGGKVGGFTIDSSKITGTNIVIDSAGSIQTSNYASDLTGWSISATGNGFAEFENAKIRGTLSTAVFEKQSVNAVGGQLYVANSTTLTGSAEAGASPTGQYTATQTTMSVENVTGFEVGEIITAKKFSGTGFGTEYMRINSASRANPSSETDFSGRIFVTRALGSGVAGNSSSLGETPSAGQTYSGSQVIVSTGKLGTGFIRINASPNDQATPYIDIVERTGSGIYDVMLKARLGDLSGLANSSYVFGNSNPGFGLATDNVFLQGGIIANTGSIGGVQMQSSKLFTGTGTFNNNNTGFYLDSTSNFSLGNKLSWNGSTLSVNGEITVTNTDSFTAPRSKSTYVTALIATGSYTSFGSFANPLFTQNGYNGAISSSVTGSDSISDISSSYDLYIIDYGFSAASTKAKLILDLFDAGYSVFSNGNDTTIANVTGSAGSEWPIIAAASIGSSANWVSGSKATGIGGLPANDPIGIGWTDFYTASWTDSGALPTRLKTDMKGASICVPFAISGSTQPDAVPELNTTARYTAFYATNPRGGKWFHTNAYVPRHIHPSASVKILDFLYRRDNAQEAYHNGFTKITGDMIQTGKIQSTNWTNGGSVGSQFNLNDGTFKLGGDASPKLSWNGSTLAVDGTVTANAGNIGGFAITANAITGSGFLLSGSATGDQFFISASNFNVKANGNVTGSQVLFTGGRIASFTLTNDALTAGSSFFISSSVGAAPATAFFISSSRFNVRQDGTITGSNVLFNGGAIGGFTISSTQLSASGFLLDSNTGELELGATSFTAGDGIYMSKTPTNNFRVGDAASSRMQFDGTNVEIYNSSNTKLVSIGNTNTIAGFTLSDSTLSNGSNFFISGSATGNGFFISASSFNVKANGDVTASNALFTGVALADIIRDKTVVITAANSSSYFDTYDYNTILIGNQLAYWLRLDGNNGGEQVRRITINCDLLYPLGKISFPSLGNGARVDVIIENNVAGNRILDIFSSGRTLTAPAVVTLPAGAVMQLASVFPGTSQTDWYCTAGNLQPFSGYSYKRGLDITGSLTITGSVTLNNNRIDDDWTSYTPIWTAASVNPVIGNGTIEGYYKLVGKTCFVRGNIAMGSTTTFGSGEWYVSMPFTASHADAILMTANLLDNGTAWYNAVLNGARAGFNTRTAIQYQAVGGTATDVRSTQPFTWTTSDRFLWNGSYEIA